MIRMNTTVMFANKKDTTVTVSVIGVGYRESTTAHPLKILLHVDLSTNRVFALPMLIEKVRRGKTNAKQKNRIMLDVKRNGYR